MPDSVGSTSWHHRHLASFHRLDALLREAAAPNPTILIVGPGAVTRVAAALLNDAATGGVSKARKLVGDAARYGDQLLRRIPRMPLRTLEPVELASAMTMPHRLVVADRSQRVLSAVARQLPRAAVHCVDISFQPIPVCADAVVAFNVICRLENPAAGMAAVVKAVRPGGLLLMDDRSAEAHLGRFDEVVAIEPKIYRRRGP